jgi:hypothetical protein
MAKLKGTAYSIIKNGCARKGIEIDPFESMNKGLNAKNISGGENDNQLNAVIERFPVLMDLIL